MPQISAKCAMLLAFLSIALLIGFIYSISTSVQAQQVAALVAAELRRTIDERQVANAAEGGMDASDESLSAELTEALQRLAEGTAPVTATSSGYLQQVTFKALAQAAERAGGVVRLAYRPGQYVLEGSVLADVWPAHGASSALTAAIQRAHVIGPQRTLQQDLEFAIDKLVQIALLALSIAINNTFNALICIDWLSDSIRMLAEQPSDWLVYHDQRGAVRVVTQPLPLTAIIDAAFSKIRYASNGNPTVLLHLLRTIGRLAPCMRTPEQREALAAQADAAAEVGLQSLTQEVDRSAVMECYTSTCHALGRTTMQERTRSATPESPANRR